MYKEEFMNLNTIDSSEIGRPVSSTMFATELIAVIPNAIAAPFQHYHEIEVKKELIESAMEHQTLARATLCNTIVELAKLGELDSEKFQMLMVAYAATSNSRR